LPRHIVDYRRLGIADVSDVGARTAIQGQRLARNHAEMHAEKAFIMATNLSTCHPGDGIQALNR
jgi:maleate cis-trans isomerase